MCKCQRRELPHMAHGQELIHRDDACAQSPLLLRAADQEGDEGSFSFGPCCLFSWEIHGVLTIACE